MQAAGHRCRQAPAKGSDNLLTITTSRVVLAAAGRSHKFTVVAVLGFRPPVRAG
jgi:hypothetical protein